MTNPPTYLTLDSGPRDDDERMVRYIVGECSPLESAQTQEWIAADPERWKRFQELERVWRASGGESSRRWDAESAIGQLRGSPETPAEPRERPRPSVAPLTLRRSRGSSRRPWNRGTMGIAAALALAAAGAVASRAITGRWPVHAARDTAADAVPLQEVATARAQRATITLSDGTRIVLGAESSVRYARDFGARARRDVYLDGQAYFEVAHDSLRPFAVHTSRGVAEDLGTEFVVTAYPETPEMQVVVASGQVLLRHVASPGPDSAIARAQTAPPLTLGPGELGIIDSSGALSRSHVGDTSPYFDWTKGELVFRGVPLREALPAIGRWYDMEIVLGDSSLASRRLVASFGPHSAHDVVRLMALAVNARYEEHGDTVVLLPRR
jgi:ferric-dicitrate binding protein FerR (iron transport regulator)